MQGYRGVGWRVYNKKISTRSPGGMHLPPGRLVIGGIVKIMVPFGVP